MFVAIINPTVVALPLACALLLQGPPGPTLGQDSLATPQPTVSNAVQVVVISSPSGQPVTLNGHQLEGTTPLSLDLNPGQYSLTVTAGGYQSLSHAFLVRLGQKLEVNFLLLRTRPKPPTPTELRNPTVSNELGNHKKELSGGLKEDAATKDILSANNACLECHPLIPKLYSQGLHRTISCKECHGDYSDHVKNGEVIATMPIARGGDAQLLCLSCHDRDSGTQFKGSIKRVAYPEHLEDKQVGIDNGCQQCHHVHAPMKWVDEARDMVGIPIHLGTIPLLSENIAEDTQQRIDSLTETFVVFPLTMGVLGKTLFNDAPTFPSNEFFISGVVLVGGSYFLGKLLHSRKLDHIQSINASRAAANRQAEEYNLRVKRKMSEYHRAVTLWQAQSVGRGTVILREQ